MEQSQSTKEYLETLNWAEVPMWKALKIWANNKSHIKCVEGNSYYFYHGENNMNVLTQLQVTNGIWFIESN